jgi:hypothetical protein
MGVADITIGFGGNPDDPYLSLSMRASPNEDKWWPIETTEVRGDKGVDPYAYVISANLHRRHLTAEQKREIVAKVLKAQPGKSNRTVAKQTKADHKTVASVRAEKQATGEIPQLDKTVGADGKARTTAPKKKRRDVDDHIADKIWRLAVKDADAPAPAPQQTDIEDCIAKHDGAVQRVLEAIAKLDEQQLAKIESRNDAGMACEFRQR